MSFSQRSFVPAFSDATHVARLLRPNGAAHVAGDFTTYTLQVFDDEGVEIYALPATAVSDTSPIFNTLQTDGYWGGRDTTGYNFRHTLKQTVLSPNTFEGGRTYTCLYLFNGGVTYGTVPATFIDECVSLAPV